MTVIFLPRSSDTTAFLPARRLVMFIALLALTLAGQPAARPIVPAIRLVALDDPTIVAIYDAANTYDIEAATLATKRGSTQQIRDFGSMLITAHTSARQQGRDLAARLHVTPTPPATNPLAADHVAAMTKLRGLSGKAFDRAFLENEVAYHKAVIGAVQTTLLPAIQNAELKALVVKVAPVFVQHQQAAEQLLAKM
jgi:putative membrane protein